MTLKSLLAATALYSLMITPAYAQSAPKMLAMLQTWQLDKPSATVQFVTKSVTEDRAVFENVVFKNKETKQGDISFGALVLERMPQADPNTKEAHFSLTFQKGSWLDKDRTKTTIDQIEVTGLTQSTNFATLIRGLNDAGPPNAAAAPRSLAQGDFQADFQGDVRITGLAAQAKDPKGAMTSIKIGNFNLLDVRLAQAGMQAKSMEMVSLEIQNSDSTAQIGKVSARDFKSDGWHIVQDASKFKLGSPGFSNLSFGSLVIEKVNMAVRAPIQGDRARKLLLSVDQIELANWTDKTIGKFGISGLKATTGQAEKRVDISLESFSLYDINVPYFTAFGAAISKELPNLAPKSNRRTAQLDKADLQLISSAPTATAPAASTPTASPKLKDLLPGGPLDGGIGAMNLSNLAIGAAGFKFTIDKINVEQGRNSAGIITSSRLDPMTMKLTFPEAMLNNPKGPTAFFAPLIADGIELVVRFNATYEPTTDVMNFTDLGYEFKGWAGIDLALAIDGLSKYYQEQTVETATRSMFAGLTSSQTPKSDKKPSNSDDMAQLKSALAPFASMRLLGGKLALSDQGGITKVAGVFASMRPPAKGATSRTGQQDAQAIIQVRQSWAAPLRENADQKDKSPMERQFLNALARWLEVGGVMTVVMQPPEPVAVPSLADPKDLPTRLGVSFTNQLPAKN
jgi:hypothetical protein